uniref:Chalcone synthase n=1 Tax=Rhizophora mucronata TaxID=61149 RepID=A0A2P2J2I8_RHIMU
MRLAICNQGNSFKKPHHMSICNHTVLNNSRCFKQVNENGVFTYPRLKNLCFYATLATQQEKYCTIRSIRLRTIRSSIWYPYYWASI